MITISRQSTQTERQSALQHIYSQVLERQPYAYERKELAKAEQDFLSGKLGVRRFIEELCKSSVYLNEFYYTCSNLKFIESCCKHLLGRAPVDQAEIAYYCDILLHHGIPALLSAIFDSDEYRHAFGYFTIPYPRSPQLYPSTQNYLHTQTIAHELYGQRGHTLPLLHQQKLGLDCNGGTCRPIDTSSKTQSTKQRNDYDSIEAEIEELLQVLRRFPDPRTALQNLTQEQKALLRYHARTR
jgi:phycoerythrin-associated linker protein